jgi:hypothetical protein
MTANAIKFYPAAPPRNAITLCAYWLHQGQGGKLESAFADTTAVAALQAKLEERKDEWATGSSLILVISLLYFPWLLNRTVLTVAFLVDR